jgi:anti-sigma B factor antagonist
MISAFFQAISRPYLRYELDELEIRQWHTAQSIIVRLFGELWSDNIERFQEAANALIDQPKRTVLLDLTGVTFIGSQGISAILDFSNRLAAAGAELRLVAPASLVRETLEAAHFHRVFKIHNSVAEALIGRQPMRAS